MPQSFVETLVMPKVVLLCDGSTEENTTFSLF